MRLITLEARTLPEAMRRLREEAGEDAILLDAREEAGGVRVTAALPGDDDDLGSLLAPADVGEAATRIAAALARHGVPVPVQRNLVEELAGNALGDPAATLASTLTRRFRFLPVGVPQSGITALIGPAGAGKTAAVARLAAAARLAGRPVTVATYDASRAGALAQLEALLSPLGLTPATLTGPSDLTKLARGKAGGGWLLVDTAGVNPFRGDDLTILSGRLAETGAEPVLVMPAGLDPQDSLEAAARFAAVGARRILVTKLDAARRLGGIVAAADAGLALAEVSHSPLIGRAMLPLTAVGLARLLLQDVAAVMPAA